MRPVSFIVLPDLFAICRLEGGSDIPEWAASGTFHSITRTADETSIVCRQEQVPEGIQCVRDWRAIRVAGVIDFSAVGVLGSLLAPLAEQGISVFTMSTFDTDYVFVRSTYLEQTVAILEAAGHELR